jgi:hypothetical protein
LNHLTVNQHRVSDVELDAKVIGVDMDAIVYDNTKKIDPGYTMTFEQVQALAAKAPQVEDVKSKIKTVAKSLQDVARALKKTSQETANLQNSFVQVQKVTDRSTFRLLTRQTMSKSVEDMKEEFRAAGKVPER